MEAVHAIELVANQCLTVSLLHGDRKRWTRDPAKTFSKGFPCLIGWFRERIRAGANFSRSPLKRKETPDTALGRPRPSRDMSSYEEPGYRSSSYAVRGNLFVLYSGPPVDGAGGYPLELILVRDLPKLSVGEFHLDLLHRGKFARKRTFPLSGSLQTVETGLILSRCEQPNGNCRNRSP